MIQIRTRPINTHALSSMRATLNSKYCMRAQMLVRRLGNNQANGQASEEFFSYQEGQHRIIRQKQTCLSGRQESNTKPPLPEEVKITKTENGKTWSISSMRVELADDILEVRDGRGKIVDALVLKRT